jgi:hypothetical protein
MPCTEESRRQSARDDKMRSVCQCGMRKKEEKKKNILNQKWVQRSVSDFISDFIA